MKVSYLYTHVPFRNPASMQVVLDGHFLLLAIEVSAVVFLLLLPELPPLFISRVVLNLSGNSDTRSNVPMRINKSPSRPFQSIKTTNLKDKKKTHIRLRISCSSDFSLKIIIIF